jgi:hypothetical protein
MNGHNRTCDTWARIALIALCAHLTVAVAAAQTNSSDNGALMLATVGATADPLLHATTNPIAENDGDAASDDYALVSIERIAVYSGDGEVYVTLSSDGDAFVDIELATDVGETIAGPIEGYRLRAGEERIGVMLPRHLASGRYSVTITSATGSETKGFTLQR